MLGRLVAAAACASSATAILSRHSSFQELQQYSFERFVKDFGRDYARGSPEWLRREQLFQQHLSEVLEFQAGPQRSWRKGITTFMDKTDAEFKAVLGYKKGGSTARTRSGSVELFRQHSERSAPLPNFADLSHNTTLGLLVRDQGSCGSCWAEASTSVLESLMERDADLMDKMSEAASTMQKLPTLSSQAIVSCTDNPRHCGGQGGCQGATAELAFELVQQRGVPLAVLWPYCSGGGQTPACRNDIFHSLRLGIAGYEVLPSNKMGPLKRALIATGAPIVVSVDATSWGFYAGGVYSDTEGGRPGEFTVNHAVTLMGFSDNTGGGQQAYWLIKNSWGSFWGEKGFIRLEMKSNEEEHCGWDHATHEGLACDGDPDSAWVCGTCGVLYDSSYPTGPYLMPPDSS